MESRVVIEEAEELTARHSYLVIVASELLKYGITICHGCDCGRSHNRGFVRTADRMTIHYSRAIATRSTLHGFFHELAHCILPQHGMRRFEKEAQAERFATDRLREYGIAVPRKRARLGRLYVARKKQHGDRIIAGR